MTGCLLALGNDVLRRKDSDCTGTRALDAFALLALDTTTNPSITLNDKIISISMTLGLIMTLSKQKSAYHRDTENTEGAQRFCGIPRISWRIP